jgi:sarcosine/dimethylglycine N-methyltransferase
MDQDARAPYDRALQRARLAAYPPGEFVGQESFMRASEIRYVAARAGITSGASVLDLCCGVGGPGLLIARELKCSYTGVDSSAAAVRIARGRAAGLDCRFHISRVPPLPRGPYDVVLLLETMLAFPDKDTLLSEIATVLPDGGRFAFTMEEGHPLTGAERAIMPEADTVRLVSLPDMLASLERAGLRVHWRTECSTAHLGIVDALLNALSADADNIAAQIGRPAIDDLLAAHRLWSDWLRSGRVRKFAIVVQKPGTARPRHARRVMFG